MLDLPRGTLYPVLPLRDIVVFPHMIVPLFVGREKSVRALEDVMKDDKQILLVTQKNAAQDDPTPADIYSVGTVGTMLQLLKLPDGTVKVLVEGGGRARITRFAENEAFFQAHAEPVPDKTGEAQELEALARTAVTQFEHYIKLNKKIPPEVLVSHQSDRGFVEARRHRGVPPGAEDSREAGAAGDRSVSASAWKRSSATWKAKSAFSRSRSASARASSARWRRRSASTTSTNS